MLSHLEAWFHDWCCEMTHRKAVIFGTASFAEVVHFYLTHDSNYEVAGFTVTEDFINSSTFNGLPVVPYENVVDIFPATEHDMFIAIGYAKLNSVREKYILDAKEKGYQLLSHICSKATHWGDTEIGENVFIFEDNTIQPFVKIGDGSILWSGNHIGHHSTIGSYCFISSHVVVSGHCIIGSYSFVGVNATITDGVTIGERNLIGPGAMIQKSTRDEEAYFGERASRYPKGSGRFFK